MKPLQSIAMGLVIIALRAWVNGEYDLLPDPIGWLLVLQGLGALPATLVHRPALRTLGFLALVMSIVLWFPSLRDGLERADESLLWAADLPQLGFVAVLCLALSRAAADPTRGPAPDPGAARWLHTAAVLTGVAAVLPVVALGAGVDSLVEVMIVGSGLVLLLVIVLMFRYSARPWAAAEVDQTAAS